MSHKLRNRIKWGQGWALADLGSKEFPSPQEFFWYYSQTIPSQAVWVVYWDKTRLGEYRTEHEAKACILRSVYGITDDILIPSEILRSADLAYASLHLWVDSWYVSATGSPGERLTIWSSLDKAPASRNIQLDVPFLTHNSGKKKKAKQERRAAEVARTYTDWHVHCKKWHLKPRVEGEPNFVPIPLDWEDCSWEARVFRPLRTVPTREYSDDECTYILELGVKSLIA